MNVLSFDINNGGKMMLAQDKHDGDVVIMKKDCENGEPYLDGAISPAEMVMLINMYRHVKSNDIQNDFINPNGRNKE